MGRRQDVIIEYTLFLPLEFEEVTDQVNIQNAQSGVLEVQVAVLFDHTQECST
jgi:hypothetical protein